MTETFYNLSSQESYTIMSHMRGVILDNLHDIKILQVIKLSGLNTWLDNQGNRWNILGNADIYCTEPGRNFKNAGQGWQRVEIVDQTLFYAGWGQINTDVYESRILTPTQLLMRDYGIFDAALILRDVLGMNTTLNLNNTPSELLNNIRSTDPENSSIIRELRGLPPVNWNSPN